MRPRAMKCMGRCSADVPVGRCAHRSTSARTDRCHPTPKTLEILGVQGITVVVFMVPHFCCVEPCGRRADCVDTVLIHSAPLSLCLHPKTSDRSKSQAQEVHSSCL